MIPRAAIGTRHFSEEADRRSRAVQQGGEGVTEAMESDRPRFKACIFPEEPSFTEHLLCAQHWTQYALCSLFNLIFTTGCQVSVSKPTL